MLALYVARLRQQLCAAWHTQPASVAPGSHWAWSPLTPHCVRICIVNDTIRLYVLIARQRFAACF
jgi:hypothetical protein